jgi:cysteine-rich repeat protein
MTRTSSVVLVLAVLAAPAARATGPLAVSYVHRDRIGALGIDSTVRGWVFTSDGRDLYVAGGDAANTAGLVAHLSPDHASGALTFLDAVRDEFGLPVVFGGLGGAMALGPDETALYYASLGDAAVFRRDANTGALVLTQAFEFSGFGHDALAVAPDGGHVLIAADDSIAVHPRAPDGTLGARTLVPATDPDAGDEYTHPTISALAIAPDGRFVYAVQQDDDGNRDAVLFFERDPATGGLAPSQRVGDGFDDYVSLGSLASFFLSPDGRDLVAGTDVYGDGEVVALRLDAQGERALRARVVGRGSGHSASRVIAVSPDGEMVVAGDGETLRLWHRDSGTGDLELVQVLTEGADGIDTISGVDDLAWSPDGRFVYVLASLDHTVTVLRRQCGDGGIDPGESCDDGNFSSADGCDTACRVEPCFRCSGVPSTCAPAAGACDDGDPCTVGDACTGGRCTGAPAVDGAPCDDGNPCTTGDACRSGDCAPSGRMACGACSVCDREVGECVGMAGRRCLLPAQTVVDGRDPVILRPPVGRFAPKSGTKALRLRWARDDAESTEGVGDPTGVTAYTVCLLDVSGFQSSPFRYDRQRRRVVAEARVPPATECRKKRCWRRTDAGAFVYRNAHGKPDGVRKLQLGRTRAGGLDLAVTAGGGAFRLGPARPIVGPLTAQVHAAGGACWQGDLKTPRGRPSASR